ncbi:MAG TPA: hypothetical protein VFZ53_12110 [Polyangiaceae bacterium]
MPEGGAATLWQIWHSAPPSCTEDLELGLVDASIAALAERLRRCAGSR